LVLRAFRLTAGECFGQSAAAACFRRDRRIKLSSGGEILVETAHATGPAVNHAVVQVLKNGCLAEVPHSERADAHLLDRFVRTRDEEAFAAVVRRHGPMVLAVCRRVLGNAADADDAFQAAFLVLARKAATVGRRGLLAPWLHGVAFNAARRLRRANSRRAVHERPVAELPDSPAPGGVHLSDELTGILDEELSKFPDRYRVPVVLCDLEGLTRKEAARQLGCPEGTVAGRLARARAMLAARLASRGIVPGAGILSALLTSRPAGALTVERLGGVVRAGLGGPVSLRVANTAERVVTAMFLRKLKTAAGVVLACGLAVAGLVGLTTSGQTVGAEPIAPPAEKSANSPRSDRPGVRTLTVIPLKSVDAARIGASVVDAYKGTPGVTVAWHAGDRSLVVYADENTTAEIDALLVKLGEEPRRKASLIRLRNSKAVEVARTLGEVFDGPRGGGQRVTVVPVAGENALLVYATGADTNTIRKLLGAAIDAAGPGPAPEKPKAEPKTYTVAFRDKPWAEVLEWYSKETGLTPVLTVKPTGTVTLMPPKDRRFTLAEVTDLLNEVLMAQKFILIRREVSFVIHPADERIDPSLIPRVEVNDLPDRGKTEIVEVEITLTDKLNAADIAPEIRKMLSPFGEVTYARGKRLVVRDAAGNIVRICNACINPENHEANLIDGFDPRGATRPRSPGLAFPAMPQANEKEGDSLVHVCKFKKAKDVADHLKTLLTDPKLEKRVTVSVDERANSVTVTGPADRIAAARKVIEDFDKGEKPLVLPELEIRKYSVLPGTADYVAKAIGAEMPLARIVPVPAANEIWVMAVPEEHARVIPKIIKHGHEAKRPE
jgi:RNA polymerase sigma factor (sigma-70 family)